jgi:hypothetical protein
MQAAVEKVICAINEDERNPYVIERWENRLGRPIAVSRGNVKLGDKIYPCDTAFDVDPGQPPGSERGTFSTFIHPGVRGEDVARFEKAVDVLNYDLPGKLVRDYTDKSQDVLYVTSERMSTLTKKEFLENLEHHAQVKAQVTPKLETLRGELRLDLKERTCLTETEAEEFARTRLGHTYKSVSLLSGKKKTL